MGKMQRVSKVEVSEVMTHRNLDLARSEMRMDRWVDDHVFTKYSLY